MSKYSLCVVEGREGMSFIVTTAKSLHRPVHLVSGRHSVGSLQALTPTLGITVKVEKKRAQPGSLKL